MSAGEQVKVLSVRLPESEISQFERLAASRGVSVQDAVHQALQSWASEPRHTPVEPLDALEGSLIDVDVFGLMRQEKEAELDKERRH